MRRPIIAGNWKMNKTPEEAAALAAALIPLVAGADCDVVICPPAVCLAAVAPVIAGTNVRLGAQNVHYEASGAYTGEISAAMLKACGVEYAIVGHSERRAYYGETDAKANLRALAALRAGIVPIICVGETLSERDAGYTDALIVYQALIATAGMTAAEVAGIVIAYEPVWAIGTGRVATDGEANDAIRAIRDGIRRTFGDAAADAVRIQYGGSMKGSNAAGLMAQPEIDGGLIGGASLKAEDFAEVVNRR